MTLCNEYHYSECHYAECSVSVVIMSNVIMLSVVAPLGAAMTLVSTYRARTTEATNDDEVELNKVLLSKGLYY
jgi:hypothetical protein